MENIGEKLFNKLRANTPISANESSRRQRRAIASKAATKLLACYRAGAAADPEGYIHAITAILEDYDYEVIAHVTDPKCGLPSTSSWPPSVYEVRQACEERERQSTAAKRQGFDKAAVKAQWSEIIDEVGEDPIRQKLKDGWKISAIRKYYRP